MSKNVPNVIPISVLNLAATLGASIIDCICIFSTQNNHEALNSQENSLLPTRLLVDLAEILQVVFKLWASLVGGKKLLPAFQDRLGIV